MGAKSELARLQVQKRLLVAKSELHRQTLAVELENLKASTAWVQRSVSLVRSMLPLLAVGAPIAGMFFSRKRAGMKTLAQKATWAWGILKMLRSFLRGFRKGRHTAGSVEPELSHFRPG